MADKSLMEKMLPMKINNCKLRGFDNYIPNREYEFLLGDIIKELDKIENKKDNRYENKKNQIQG